MTDASDLSQAQRFPLASLRRYLAIHGWSQDPNISRVLDLYSLNSGEMGRLGILVPRNTDHADSVRRIAEALRTLAQLESRSIQDVSADVRSVSVDVWRSVLPDAVVLYDSVRLDVAESFVKNAKGLLAAAATTEANPKPFFGRTTKAAVIYSDDCRFAHTFRGSFGFAIESPVDANFSPSMPGVDELPPLPRRVMQRMARGIKQVARAGRERDPNVIAENFETGFSANMCEDFVDLMEATSGSTLVFNFAFSPEWRTPADIKGVESIQLSPVHIDLVKDAARQLRLQEFERKQVIVGRVVRLESESDPSDLFKPEADREIVVQWNSEDFGQIRVRVVLPGAEYLEALGAHGRGQWISIEGTIDRQGRYWLLLDPRNFRIIPQVGP